MINPGSPVDQHKEFALDLGMIHVNVKDFPILPTNGQTVRDNTLDFPGITRGLRRVVTRLGGHGSESVTWPAKMKKKDSYD